LGVGFGVLGMGVAVLDLLGALFADLELRSPRLLGTGDGCLLTVLLLLAVLLVAVLDVEEDDGPGVSFGTSPNMRRLSSGGTSSKWLQVLPSPRLQKL
jgi:hypothetical protein